MTGVGPRPRGDVGRETIPPGHRTTVPTRVDSSRPWPTGGDTPRTFVLEDLRRFPRRQGSGGGRGSAVEDDGSTAPWTPLRGFSRGGLCAGSVGEAGRARTPGRARRGRRRGWKRVVRGAGRRRSCGAPARRERPRAASRSDSSSALGVGAPQVRGRRRFDLGSWSPFPSSALPLERTSRGAPPPRLREPSGDVGPPGADRDPESRTSPVTLQSHSPSTPEVPERAWPVPRDSGTPGDPRCDAGATGGGPSAVTFGFKGFTSAVPAAECDWTLRDSSTAAAKVWREAVTGWETRRDPAADSTRHQKPRSRGA